MTLIEKTIASHLTDLASVREYVISHALDIPPYRPQLRCNTCGGNNPEHPAWISLTRRCEDHNVNVLI